MRVLSSVLLLVSTALAYQVTYPGGDNGWTTTGPNNVEWERVDTDPATFAMFLTNVNNGNNNLLLNSVVNGSLGSIVANTPSGGWPTGSGFRVNFAQDSDHPDSLLAQSNQFNITEGSSTQSSTASSSSSGSSGSSASTQTGSGTTTVNGATASLSSSATSTSPTGTNDAPLRADTQSGFLTAVAAVAALFTTLF